MGRSPRHHLRRACFALCVAVALVALGAGPAAAHSAHGGDEAEEASVLVRQGIALIVNTPGDTMAIEDKVNDAIETDDHDGVDVSLVRQAADALDAGDLHRVRALLEVSIGARPHMSSALPGEIQEAPGAPGAGVSGVNLATGDEPGGGLADDPLDADRHLDGRTTAMLVLSLVLVAAGIGLAIRYRPTPTRRLRTGESA
jgi:hypothetical protein